MAKKKFDFSKALIDQGLNIGGGIAAKLASKKVMPNMNSKLKNGALLGISILAPSFFKNDMVSKISTGMGTVAGMELAGSFVPALAGMDDDIVTGIGYDSNDYMHENETVEGFENDDVTV